MVIPATQNSLIGRFAVLVGVAVVVSACSGSGGSSSSNSNGGGATPASVSQSDQLVLEIQPIQVCDDSGFVCAQVEFFETITAKIWDQADIDITFLPLNQLNDSTYLTTDDNEFSDLSFSGDAGDFGRHPDSTRTQGPINLWFVDVIETSTGLVQFGNAWVGLNGVLISDDILDFNNGVGRIDVIAHEIGHNLGLRHSTLGAGTPENLMSSGGVRTIPDSIDNIFPDGDGLSQLTLAQIERAQDSSFVTEAAADEIVPVTAADAIPLSDGAPDGASDGSVVELSAVFPDKPIIESPEADVLSLLTSSQTIAAAPVPESSPTFLPWLLLLPLGQRIYRQISRCSNHG